MSTQPKWMTIVGWILTVLVSAMLTMSAFAKFSTDPQRAEQIAKMGFTPEVVRKIGMVEAVCVILYLVPQTAVLGAVLLTGYLGGAVETHVRLGDEPMKFLTPAIIGAVAWLGLFFRDGRVRSLLPIRKSS